MINKLHEIRKKILDELSSKEYETLDELERLHKKYFGRKGEFTLIFRGIKELAADEKKEFGKRVNEIRQEVEEQFHVVTNTIREFTGAKKTELFDGTLPGVAREKGTLHPITQMTHLIWETFANLNFNIIQDGPEVESDHYNFEALNIPADHPARDMHDTFYLGEQLLLRTHTSPMQVRYMENHQPPVRIIVTGKCYRKDPADMSHAPMFHQFEGLMIDTDITLEHLKNVLQTSMSTILGKELDVRFRTSYFPFVEPGAEFDVSCTLCNGTGCSTCKKTGWLEIGGCGMVHPNVLSASGYDPKKLQGFAFGFGVERVFMIKHQVNDMRLLFGNDLRFLLQF